jgi:hypothetical protein
VIKDLIFFGFGSKIRRYRRRFMSIGSAYSTVHKRQTVFWRILLICLYALTVFAVQAKILLAYSETTWYSKTTLKSPLLSPLYSTLKGF